MANDSLSIDNVDRRPVRDVPLPRNGAVRAFGPPGAPVDAVLGDGGADHVEIGVAVDTQESEGPIAVFFDERPLVGIKSPARRSPMPPEVEHDDLAAVIAEPERNAVEIRAADFRRRLADLRPGKRHRRRRGLHGRQSGRSAF